MINWIDNHLRFSGDAEAVQKVKKTIAAEGGGPLDFNKIMPPPPFLDVEPTLGGETAYRMLLKKGNNFLGSQLEGHSMELIFFAQLSKREKRKAMKAALRLDKNKRKHGYVTETEWREANWATAPNAEDARYDPESDQIYFRTATLYPYPVIQELSAKFDQVKIWWKYYDLLGGSVAPVIHHFRGGYVQETTALSYETDILPGGLIERRVV